MLPVAAVVPVAGGRAGDRLVHQTAGDLDDLGPIVDLAPSLPEHVPGDLMVDHETGLLQDPPAPRVDVQYLGLGQYLQLRPLHPIPSLTVLNQLGPISICSMDYFMLILKYVYISSSFSIKFQRNCMI